MRAGSAKSGQLSQTGVDPSRCVFLSTRWCIAAHEDLSAAKLPARAMSSQVAHAQVDPTQITPRPELLPHKTAEQWKKQDDVLARHLNEVFSPLQFPPELASRILTHASHPDAARRHNARLSFVGEYMHPLVFRPVSEECSSYRLSRTTRFTILPTHVHTLVTGPTTRPRL